MPNVHFSSKSDEWSTPPELFRALDNEFQFTLDPCATRENTTCLCYMDLEEDGLKQSWKGHRCFVNPPYSALREWVAKCAQESLENGVLSVMLIPARTDTRAWHDHIWDDVKHCPRPGVQVRLLRGRLKFGGCKNSAPFPSAIVVFNSNQHA